MIKIITPYRNCYYVNEKGFLSNNQDSFSGDWVFKGIKSVKSNLFISFSELTKDRLKSLTLLYKNSHPKFTIVDIDHGTTRIHGNTIYHGVGEILFY